LVLLGVEVPRKIVHLDAFQPDFAFCLPLALALLALLPAS